MTGLAQIRSTFLDFFKKQGHEVVASSPLVPRNDPTLMFANSGMVQFKNVFTGAEKRSYSRATSAQKCVRAGGKHNDLDNVGYTARHHTFFEMLGNFSFGDYFKPDAIEWAWNLINKEYGLPKDRLSVTVYHNDDDAFNLWKKIAGLPDSRIIRIPTADNFWAMGDTGPCGPCSEIFFDHGDKIWGGPPGSPEQDGDRFIEIWNLVFMQYEQIAKDNRVNLPRPSIDTGMGLERISAVLQGTHDNYETDLFRTLIANIVENTGVAAEGAAKASNRVIADHLRATSFLIADGVTPSNEGRGYVLRRIMRRAMRHAELLGMKEPLMWKLVPALVREMGAAYPELIRGQAMITETLKLEETRFRTTLVRGMKLLADESSSLVKGDTFNGETAFKLYDTFGFPLDLTQDALKSRGIGVDGEAFAKSMAKQKSDARAAWKGSGEEKTDSLWFDIRERVGATEFLGYDTERAEGEVMALTHDGKDVTSLAEGQSGSILVNQTPFYGESGGQTGDHGVIRRADGALFVVSETQKRLGDVFVHVGKVEKGSFRTGQAVELEVDNARRSANRQHHSATHLLHEALRRVLGEHVAQKGSLVEPTRLRFDFSHTKAVSAVELGKVEAIANAQVALNDQVNTRLMSVDAARAEGAMALFGEKYEREVRVLNFGEFSTELCGGTHVSRTGDIGLFRIVSEGGVAAGVRRIEAVTGEGALDAVTNSEAVLRDVAALVRGTRDDLADKVREALDRIRAQEREIRALKDKLASGQGTDLAVGAVDVDGTKVIAAKVDGADSGSLRTAVDQLKSRLGSAIIVLAAVESPTKVILVAGVTADRTAKVKAGELVGAVAAQIGGKGGGRPDFAQAGGNNPAALDAALASVLAQVRARLQ